MRKRVATAALGLALLCGAGRASAQGILPFALEARGGLTLPTSGLSSASGPDVGSAVSFNVNATYSPLPGISLYGGLGRDAFDCGDGCDLRGTGVDAGLRLSVPTLIPFPLRPWVKTGLLAHHLRGERSGGGARLSESDLALGWELGGGVTLNLLPPLTLTPGLRYRRLLPDLGPEFGGARPASYLVLDMALRLAP